MLINEMILFIISELYPCRTGLALSYWHFSYSAIVGEFQKIFLMLDCLSIANVLSWYSEKSKN